MKSAYENWLIEKVKFYSGDVQINELSLYIQHELAIGNNLAFDIVNRAGDEVWTLETFRKAAIKLLNKE